MNFQVLGSTFLMIFLAELGDKRQISTFAFASESRVRLSVFFGAALALVCTSAIFLGFGGWTLAQAIRG